MKVIYDLLLLNAECKGRQVLETLQANFLVCMEVDYNKVQCVGGDRTVKNTIAQRAWRIITTRSHLMHSSA